MTREGAGQPCVCVRLRFCLPVSPACSPFLRPCLPLHSIPCPARSRLFSPLLSSARPDPTLPAPPPPPPFFFSATSGALSFAWSQTAGPQLNLLAASGGTAASPTLLLPPGTLAAGTDFAFRITATFSPAASSSGGSAPSSASATVTVKVAAVEPPKLVSARLDAAGLVLLAFSAPTNRFGAPFPSGDFASEPCAAALAPASLAALGGGGAGGCACAWQSNSTLAVRPGPAATLQPGGAIALRSDGFGLRTWDGSSAATSAPADLSATLETPAASSAAAVPTAVVSAPSEVGPCTDLVLDGGASSLGGFGRALRFVWAFSRDASVPASFWGSAAGGALADALGALITARYGAGSAATAAAALQSPHPPVLVLPASALTARAGDVRYAFTLTVANWLGATHAAVASVLAVAGDAPTVRVQGPRRVFAAPAAPLVLVAEPALPACLPSAVAASVAAAGSARFSFAWSLALGPDVLLLNANQQTLTVRAFALQPGARYVFQVAMTAEFPASLNSNATTAQAAAPATVEVLVSSPPLRAVIAGGSLRVVGAATGSGTLVLNATQSVDPAAPAAESVFGGGRIAFSWACVRPLSGAACAAALPLAVAAEIARNNGSSLSVPLGALLPVRASLRASVRASLRACQALRCVALCSRAGNERTREKG